jgi:hypothetical protein
MATGRRGGEAVTTHDLANLFDIGRAAAESATSPATSSG